VLDVVAVGLGGVDGPVLHRHDGEALGLEPAEDLAHEATPDGVGLEQDERALGHGRQPSDGAARTPRKVWDGRVVVRRRPRPRGATMRAVQFEQYGDPGVLQVGDAPDPHAGPGEVRIAVEASGVNPFDWKVRSGMLKDAIPLDLPHVLGLEAAGVVDEVGDGVVGVAIGDRVFGNGSATYAELAVLKAFAPIPGALTM